MADNIEAKRTQETQEQSRAAARGVGQGIGETMQKTASAVGEAGLGGGAAIERGGRAGAQAVRHLGGAAADATQCAANGIAQAQEDFAEQSARQFEHAMNRLSRSVTETAQEWRTVFQIPELGRTGLQDMRRAMNQTLESVMRANVQAAQEIFRNSNMLALADMRQRFMRDYLRAMLDGGAAMARAVHRSSEQVLQQLDDRPRRAGLNGACVADVMEREVRLASPDDTVQQAARIMREADTGALPVGEGDRLVGMVTDRDVAMRLAADGRDPSKTKVRDVMTAEVRYVFEDEDLARVAESMAQQKVRRLPVMNRQKRLVGVVSLGDLAKERPDLAGRALEGAAREGGPHQHVAAQ